LTSQTREGTPVRITVRHVGQIEEGDRDALMVYGKIMRLCMGKLDLQLVGRRDLFDPKNAVSQVKLCHSIDNKHVRKPFLVIKAKLGKFT